MTAGGVENVEMILKELSQGNVSYITDYLIAQVQHPLHLAIEAILVLFIIYIITKRPDRKKSLAETLTANEIDELIAEYHPAPLCPPLSEKAKLVMSDIVTIDGSTGTKCRVVGYEDKVFTNFTSYDFLGFGERKELKDVASAALSKYGCGSCGPRGFYGTIDAHVYLEDAIAKYFGQEESIMYSDGTSAVSSAIPAFASRADLLVIDAGVNDAVLTGCKLSRAKLRFFRHNDVDDLHRILQEVEQEDIKLKRKIPQRRFIVVEGLYRNYGDIVPLDKILPLKKKYKWRLFADESCSFGTLGAHGLGVTEHFNLPVSSVEILVASLATSLASVGGFCVGIHEVVEHQRLNGAGYCFSASSPPFIADVARASLRLMETEGSKALEKLASNARKARLILKEQAKNFKVCGDEESPIIFLVLADHVPKYSSMFELEKSLRNINKLLRERQILVSVATYTDIPVGVTSASSSDVKPGVPIPSIRILIKTTHNETDFVDLAKNLAECSMKIIKT